MDKIIFHVDVNAAFLSWEAVYRLRHKGGRLDLRKIPSAVGGDMAMRHGIILAKSIPAKKYGIQTGETILEAKRKCPELVLVPPNYELYEKSSRAFMRILAAYSDVVEQYSIDEAFLDMSATAHLFGGAVAAAERLRAQIREELGFTVNVGVSDLKSLAKMASDFRKPDQVHTLYREEMEKKLWPLPVSELFFVGRATAKKLFSLGIRTIGELAEADPDMLKLHLKKQGEVIWGFANGLDLSAVQAEAPPNKGYGNSTTVAFDVKDAGTAKLVLLALAETVAARLREDKRKAGLVAVGIKDSELRYMSHQMVLETATNITSKIHQAACRLFDELWNGHPIRHLGIHTGRLQGQDSCRQLELFDPTDYGKLEQGDAAIDVIRRRFGMDAVKRAVFLDSPVDHLSGGISREKRRVDYSRIKVE